MIMDRDEVECIFGEHDLQELDERLHSPGTWDSGA